MEHHKTIVLPRDLLRKYNELLESSDSAEDAGKTELLHTITTAIENTEYEVDIKIVNSESGCYVDAVLFHNNHEVMCLEPSYERLEGDYIFEDGDTTIKITIDKK